MVARFKLPERCARASISLRAAHRSISRASVAVRSRDCQFLRIIPGCRMHPVYQSHPPRASPVKVGKKFSFDH